MFREILESPGVAGYKEFYYAENGDIIQWNILDYGTGRYEERWYWPGARATGEMIKKKSIAYEPDGSVCEKNYDENGKERYKGVKSDKVLHLFLEIFCMKYEKRGRI